jgi:hypothetical protein
VPPVSAEEIPPPESYALAETVSGAAVRPRGITSQDVALSPRIAETAPSPSEAVPVEGIQIASEAQFGVGDRLAALSEEAAGELPDAEPDIEPSAALTAAPGKETDDSAPQQAPLLAERSPVAEPMSSAMPTEDEPELVPAPPIPAPMTSAAVTAGASPSAEDEPGLVPPQPIPAPVASAVATRAVPSAEYVQRFPMVVLNGTPLGAITLREFEGNQRLIHLGALLSLFRSRMDPAEFEKLISAGAADQFLSLEELRRAGLDIQYDARRGRLIIGSGSGPLDE